jgi:hypothetical protein
MTMTDRAREEKIRADLEAAFRGWDGSMTQARHPRLRSEVERVELFGSYPDTVLIVLGTNEKGERVKAEYPLWTDESLFDPEDERADAGAIGLVVTEYVEE